MKFSMRQRFIISYFGINCLQRSFLILLFLSGFSKFGYYLIDVLHRVPQNVSQIAKDSILYLSVFPLVDGFVG